MQNTALVLDLLQWLDGQQLPYDQVMAAWRSTCPRLTVWEDAVDAGLVQVRANRGSPSTVSLTGAGAAMLNAHRGAGSLSRRPPAS